MDSKDTMEMINSSFEKIEKNELKRIELSQLPKDVPNLKSNFEPKDSIIKKWLSDWIVTGLNKGQLKVNTLLPKKSDLASHLGVSIGTVQNAIRSIENTGIIESKQRIGTIIRDTNADNPIIRKASSKRDKVVMLMKKYIVENNFKPGDGLPSSRTLAGFIGHSTNTIRLALDTLYNEGLIEPRAFRSNESNWILTSVPEVNEHKDKKNVLSNLGNDTLVVQVESDLKTYIKNNHKIGDRLPAHFELSEMFKVSVKTVHDAMKNLIDEGILLSRRGRYGTTIIKMPDDNLLQPANEISFCGTNISVSSIFAKAEDAAFYSYQKIENEIKTFISDNFEVGDKIPSMDELSQRFDVSTNTIRKALQNLAQMGYVSFLRGRYGGTFVTEVPESESQETFRWLAVSPNYTLTNDSQN